jgi:hypothetical protein
MRAGSTAPQCRRFPEAEAAPQGAAGTAVAAPQGAAGTATCRRT